jgi:hypothetical protein
MKTEDLIHTLSARVEPVRPLNPPSVRLLSWLALALPAVAVVAVVMGLRADLGQRLGEMLFDLRLVSSLATAALAALAALALGVPGRSRARALAPLPPLVLWMASLGRQCFLEIQGAAEKELLAGPHLHCLPDIAVMIALPTLAMVALVLRGAGFRRRLELALGGLAAAALANTALSLAHPVDAGVLTLAAQMAVIAVLSLFLGKDASLTPLR